MGKQDSVERGRERLRRVIDLCRRVEQGEVDPFAVEVGSLLAIIRELFPNWKSLEDLCLDVEAVEGVSTVVKRQGEWVEGRSTKLYRDPFLIEEKLRSLNKEALAEIFLRSWHPVVELEQITPYSLENALRYWGELKPLADRLLGLQAETREVSAEPPQILTEDFEKELLALWEELKERTREGKIRYWDFILADSYEETAKRAYLTSFLITYGYARLEVHTFEEEMYLTAVEEPSPPAESARTISVPIAINFEEWRRLRNAQKA